MKPVELIARKYRQGWTDAEAMVLMQLADMNIATCTEIVESCGMPMTTVWRAIQVLSLRQIIFIQVIRDEKYYSLTDQGRTALILLLK